MHRNQKSAEMEQKLSFRVGRETKEAIMLAVLATLTFLIAMWLCAGVATATLEHSGLKIIAALKGRSLLAALPINPIAGRISQRYPSPQRPVRARVELRAAA